MMPTALVLLEKTAEEQPNIIIVWGRSILLQELSVSLSDVSVTSLPHQKN